SEGLVMPAPYRGNLRGPTRLAIFARPAQARQRVDRADFRGGTAFRGVFRTQVQVHTALEPHGCVARWADGGLELWASTQSVSFLAEDVADRWDLPRERVVVHADFVGGAFGAKVGLSPEHAIAIDLARLAGKPVRVANDRQEEMTVGGFRPGGEIHMDVGLTPAGELAIHHTGYGDGGCSIGNATGFVTRLIYDTPYKDIDDYDVLTHAPPGKPMRGPGAPMTMFALEGALDQLAHDLGEDPIALRRRYDPNVPRSGLYAWAAALPTWAERGAVAADTGRYRRGVGLAAGTWFQVFDASTQVELEVTAERIVARSATQDMGNGARSTIAHALAAALGVPLSGIEVEAGISTLVHGPAASGSRCTSSLVPACEDAARLLREELAELARERGLSPDAPIAEILRGQPPLRVVGRRRKDDLPPLIPIAMMDFKAGRRFTGTVAVVEVEVDTRLGRVTAKQGHVGVGVGRIVVERLARSQVEGSFVQSLGFALYEQRRLDPGTGRLVTHNLDDYRIPGIGDIPPVDVHFEPRGFEHVRGGAVGVGEVGGVAVPAAVANAVFHATGRRPLRLPLSPEHVSELLA
ncbi:MAG: molybdopterin-dependent oxidoreductase, partial [Myxococcales bacterium]|nr:molybdopterin-dependent oxidoreductase [Myxococcales bacterium]